MFNEFAIERLFSTLTRVPDPDVALRSAGMTREKLRALEADDEILSALETRRDACIGTAWRLEMPSDGDAVDWLWAELEPRMDALLRGAWSAVPYGYSVIEATYERRDDGRVGLASLIEKPMEWFEPRPDGSLLWIGQRLGLSGQDGEILDTRFKFLLTRRNPSYRNPFGESLLSRLYWAWFFRHNAWRFWMQFIERFGDPLILGQVIEPTKFVKALQGLGMNAVVGVDREDKISAITQGAPGEFSRVEAGICARIQKLILGQTLTTQMSESGGSYAAAEVHNEVRDDKRISDIRLVTPTVQRLVDALWMLNRFSGSPPTFVLADGQGLESERAERDARLVGAGAMVLTEQYLLRAYDFEQGDVMVPDRTQPNVPRGTSPQSQPGEPGAPAQASALLQFARRKFTKSQMEVEGLADRSIAAAGSPISRAALRRAVLAASSPLDLADRLAALMPEAPPAEFQAALEQALYAADVFGYCASASESGAEERPPAEADEPSE